MTSEITIQYGTPLEMICDFSSNLEIMKSIQWARPNANQPIYKILFYKNSVRISDRYVTIINSTAAYLDIPNPPVGNDNYYCKLIIYNQLITSDNPELYWAYPGIFDFLETTAFTWRKTNIEKELCVYNVTVGRKYTDLKTGVITNGIILLSINVFNRNLIFYEHKH